MEGLTAEQHQQANELAVAFANTAAVRKPWDFGNAFGFFAEQVRLGCDVGAVMLAIAGRNRTHSASQFWITEGFAEPLKPKKKAVSKEDILAELRKGSAE